MSKGDYISREAALKAIYTSTAPALEVMAMPAANVVEVRYCRFSLEEVRRRESVYKCSACGYYLTVRADTLNGGRADMNYCPFCGRKMIHKGQDGGQNETREEAEAALNGGPNDV